MPPRYVCHIWWSQHIQISRPISNSVYRLSILLHSSTCLPDGFPTKDDGVSLFTWVFGLCFPSSQWMHGETKIRHTIGYILSQSGCRKGTRLIYKLIELRVRTANCVPLSVLTVREQGSRKQMYKTDFIISFADGKTCKPSSFRCNRSIYFHGSCSQASDSEF